ncbi:MAG: DsrE family protein [Gammaproteobacteria bacterium]
MAVTRCLAKTKHVKVLYQINTECKNASCGAPYAIGNIMNHINDYEITHGMDADDYEIVVVVHSAGWKLVLDNNAIEKHSADNPFQTAMEDLVARPSVKVFFCQNTANSKGVVKANMIDGIGYVTAGVSAISDLQEMGYRYVQP